MKYVFLFALALLSFTLPAQNSTTVSTTTSSSTSVSESTTNDAYSFRVKVDRQQLDELVSVYIKLAGITGISKIVGFSSFTTDEGAVIKLNTKKRTLRISSDDNQPTSVDVARGLADQVREKLGLTPAPAPPALPRND